MALTFRRAGPDELWPERQPLFDHLARTAAHSWLAEEDGTPVDYARSIARDGTIELTEFFVSPGRQSARLGRELMARAFPAEGVRHRSIIATPDLRALARYLRAGLAARFPIYGFTRNARPLPLPAGIVAHRMDDSTQTLDTLAAIDRANLGFRRDLDHHGSGRCAKDTCFAREAAWSGSVRPAVLMHAEHRGAALTPVMSLDVPLVNRTAAGWLLGQEYRMSDFVNYYLSDAPTGHFERHIITTPSFFV